MSDDSSAPVSADVSDSVDQGTDEVSENTETQAVAPKPSNKKTFKIKVDGEEFDEELDFDDEEGIKRHLQMSKAAQKRMNEGAQAKRKAEQFMSMLKSNPLKVLQDPSVGVDFRKLAEDYIAEQIEMETLSPEERKYREMESRLREHEEGQKKTKADAEAEQLTKLQEHYAQDYDKKITEALSTSGLPKTPKTVRRMAQLMSKNLEMGLDLDPSHVVNLVREDYLSEIKELFGATDGDSLLKLLGDDVANKIRKSDLARLKGSKNDFGRKEQTQDAPKSQPARRMSTEEWMAEIRRKARS